MQSAVREYVRIAATKTQPSRFSQEHAYLNALLASLQGIVYNEKDGFVEFSVTSINDKGKGAAEHWSGIDCVITANIKDENNQIDKAIIFQAKRGEIQSLRNSERLRLNGQIRDMKKLSRSPKIIELPYEDSNLIPTVISANRVLSGKTYKQTPLPDYFIQRVLTTFDGDTRPDFVNAVQESSLLRLKLIANIEKSR
jgi:hypothetical protein